MALTETWIKPEDTTTPAALSTNFTFSHTPRTIGRGGGTGLLPSLTGKSKFESHAITHPAKIHFVHSKCPGVKSTRLGVYMGTGSHMYRNKYWFNTGEFTV